MRHGLAAALLAMGALSGCGGEGGLNGPRGGRLDGIATRGGTDRNVVAFASEGRFLAAEFSGTAFFFDGEYDRNGGTLSGTARIYGGSTGAAHIRGFTEAAPLSGTVDGDDWEITIAGASGSTTFTLYRADDGLGSSLSAVEGTWVYDPSGSNTSTLTIAADGATSSTNDSGCASNGSIAVIDGDFDLYDSATTVADGTGPCPDPVEGSYTGLITLIEDYGVGGLLMVMLAKAEYMLFYQYTAQP